MRIAKIKSESHVVLSGWINSTRLRSGAALVRRFHPVWIVIQLDRDNVANVSRRLSKQAGTNAMRKPLAGAFLKLAAEILTELGTIVGCRTPLIAWTISSCDAHYKSRQTHKDVVNARQSPLGCQPS